MRALLACCTFVVVFLSAMSIYAGTHGTIQVAPVSDGTIVIDGSFADWPLSSFTTPSRQPDWPDGQNAGETDALGDHLLYEAEKVFYFGQGGSCHDGDCAVQNNGPGDFGSALYMTYDSKALYFLGVFLDDFLQGTRDVTEFGDNTYLNDGFEIFVDVFNDTDDSVADFRNPPNIQFDDEEPNLDDIQISFGLNENFQTGARQHMERSGRPGLIGGFGRGEPYEVFDDIVVGERNGPGGIYREALEAFGQNVAATIHDDMGAIGAPNPEISANPATTFTGYVLEAAVPFGFADLDDDGETNDDFVPAKGKTMGFSMFWNDTDGDTDEEFGGVDLITRIMWTQGGVFAGNNWGQIEFTGDVEFGGGPTVLQAGDADMDLDFDQLDLVKVQVAGKYLTGAAATWGEGDWNGAPGGSPGSPPAGDGLFNQRDIIAALGSAKYLTGPYAVLQPNGEVGDGQTSVVYNAGTGELAVDAPAGIELTSINIDSAAGIFTGESAQSLGGSFDNDADGNIFKATFGSSFGSLSFGNVAQAGLSQEFVLNDLSVVGSLAGGGDLGNVDLIYVPEPSTIGMLVFGMLFALRRFRRMA